MSMGKRYTGGFYSVANTLYRVEIWQEGYSGAAANVAFGESPVTIEWQEVDKLEPVMSSSAKLQLFSDSDRQFVDLYTIKAGSVRMDVYRSGSLYWSGTLDPELYEEPFAYKDGYVVSLSFADFAILDRLNYTLGGFRTLRQLFTHLVESSCIRHNGIFYYIGTKLFGTSSETLIDAIAVQSQNFYDEDGDAMSLRKVLDETLRPFALHLVQKGGNIYLYDTDTLLKNKTATAVNWSSDDAVLSVDKVYNDVKVTFSPYEKTDILKADVDADSVGGGQKLTTWFSTAAEADEIGFYTHLSDTGKGVEKHADAKYFKIEPVYSGSKEAGVAWTVETFASRNSGVYVNYIKEPTYNIGGILLTSIKRPYLSSVPASDKYKLKLSLSMLFDPRYNPFEDSSVVNEEGNWKDQQNRANFVYVPFKLTVRNDSGVALYHYDNKGVKNSSSFARPGSLALWRTGEASWGDAWLCWYQGNRKNESGIGGWQVNKQSIGYYRGNLPTIFDKLGNGELISLPPVGGYLELQIGTGVVAYDYGKEIKESVYSQCRWLLYKDAAIDVVQHTGSSISAQDIETKAWLNRDAKEGLKIDTKLGCMDSPSPAALGQLFKTSDFSACTSFWRAGNTDTLERLMIGTIYSQYAEPLKKLGGEVDILADFGIYTDKHEPGNYIVLAESQDLRNDTDSIVMVQVLNDNYTAVKYG